MEDNKAPPSASPPKGRRASSATPLGFVVFHSVRISDVFDAFGECWSAQEFADLSLMLDNQAGLVALMSCKPLRINHFE